MKTQLVTLSSLFILSFSSVVSANDQATEENTNQVTQEKKNYHSQDIRNVQSNIRAGYETIEELDVYSVEGTFGFSDKMSMSLGYKQFMDGDDDESSDMLTLSGQYNVSNNIVIDGEWNVSDDSDYFAFGGNYVADAGFGVMNVGANYISGEEDDVFDIEAGVLVPFGNMYYRGDFTYFLDSESASVFENALGWTNGNIDVNASVTMYEFEDTSVGIEFGYLF